MLHVLHFDMLGVGCGGCLLDVVAGEDVFGKGFGLEVVVAIEEFVVDVSSSLDFLGSARNGGGWGGSTC